MKRSPLITVIIVTFNSRNVIGQALTSLHETYDTGLADVIVVDNASSDNTVTYITDNYKWVKTTISKENIGFGRGCNLGAQHIQTPYILIHNPDAVITYEALQILVNYMTQNKQTGISAPAIIEGDSHIQTAGQMTSPTSLLRKTFGIDKEQGRPITPDKPPFQTSWICGAMMLIRTDLYNKLEGFDPRFFLYFEETDFCRRATLQGAEIWAIGKAVAKHIGGASAETTGELQQSSCIAEHFIQSRFYYLVKHFGWLQAIGCETTLKAISILRNLKHKQQKSKHPLPFLQFPKKPENYNEI